MKETEKYLKCAFLRQYFRLWYFIAEFISLELHLLCNVTLYYDFI